MDADKKPTGFFSKYVLDHLKHQLILSLECVALGMRLRWQLSYKQRALGETYFVGDCTVARQFKARDFILEPFLRIDNFSNSRYSEVADVLMPGRWIQAGARLEW